MAKKATLAMMHKQLHEKKDIEQLENIPRGERSGFLKITITIPADMLSELRTLGMKRKSEGKKDTDTSSLIRESIRILLDSTK